MLSEVRRPRPRPRPARQIEPEPSEDAPKPPRHRSRNQPAVPNWLFYTITLVIVGLWTWGIVLSLVSPGSFTMPPSLNAAFPVVLVGIYSTKALSDNKKKNGGDDE